MITVLIDHNIEGHALRVWEAFQAQGWSDVISLNMLTFDAVDLAFDSSDRDVWRFAQAQSMVLLTANRNMNEADSLERTIREENGPSSLPVLTIGNPNRISQRVYRETVALRLAEIAMELDRYLGMGRIYLP
jgi:hypothetical protein